MQIKDIASQIVEMEKVPTYFNNTKIFFRNLFKTKF